MKKIIVLYDNRDGEVLLKSPYVSKKDVRGLLLEMRKDIIKIFGNANYVNHGIFDYTSYGDSFMRYNNIRIYGREVFFSNMGDRHHVGYKHCMTDRWFPYFYETAGIIVDGIINEDRLNLFYHDFIEFNLKSLRGFITNYYASPLSFKRANDSNESFLVRWDTDVFPNRKSLREDLLENPMVFPIQIRRNNDQCIILDGSHKVSIIKELHEQGLWDINRKILTLEFDSTSIHLLDNPNINYILETPIVMHIPHKLLDKYSFIPYKNPKKFSGDIMEVTIERYLDAITIFRMYVLELTYPIKVFTEKNPGIFKAATIIEERLNE